MISKQLNRWSHRTTILVMMAAAFGTYFSMYAFRKPFTVGLYEEAAPIGQWVDFKIALIIAQVLGYASSKFIGIKVISELHPSRRFRLLLGLTVVAALALLGFGLSKDSPWSLLWLLLNGLPLGMVWGIVFSYLEGRRETEVLGAALCASFIVASGATKSVGAWLMQDWQVSVYWMPLLTALLFSPLLLFFGTVLDRLPGPRPEDIAHRTARRPMNRAERWSFFRELAPGLLALIVCYVGVTIYRDFRDNFAAEIWTALGYGNTPAVFTLAELPIAVLVLVMLALTVFIQNNQRALLVYHWIILAGCLLIGGSTLAYQFADLRGDAWMVIVGAGLYLIYVPFNAILFDRLIAAFRHVATAGFLIYVADAWGYAGSVSTLLYKNFGQAELNWHDFFLALSYIISVVAAGATISALVYFYRKMRQEAVEASLVSVGATIE